MCTYMLVLVAGLVTNAPASKLRTERARVNIIRTYTSTPTTIFDRRLIL